MSIYMHVCRQEFYSIPYMFRYVSIYVYTLLYNKNKNKKKSPAMSSRRFNNESQERRNERKGVRVATKRDFCLAFSNEADGQEGSLKENANISSRLNSNISSFSSSSTKHTSVTRVSRRRASRGNREGRTTKTVFTSLIPISESEKGKVQQDCFTSEPPRIEKENKVDNSTTNDDIRKPSSLREPQIEHHDSINNNRANTTQIHRGVGRRRRDLKAQVENDGNQQLVNGHQRRVSTRDLVL